VGLVGQPVDIHISLIRSYCSGLDWRGLEKGRMLKMLKRHWPAVHWRDFDDGNEWQHHVDCLEGIPQELRQVFFGQWREATSFFPFRRALADFCRMQQRQRICKSPAISHLIHLSSWPLHAQDRPTATNTCVSSVDHVSVLVVRRNFTHI
jgi:hypothetical protein